MQALADFAASIEQRVQETHLDVLIGLLDELERRIDRAEEIAKRCSYRAALGDYTYMKIFAHHMRKHLHDSFGKTAERFGNRLADAERIIRGMRVGMYDNVCLKCAACRSRIKPWPAHAVFNHSPTIEPAVNVFGKSCQRQKTYSLNEVAQLGGPTMYYSRRHSEWLSISGEPLDIQVRKQPNGTAIVDIETMPPNAFYGP